MAPVVLVVEDEPLISMWVEEALEDAGYIVLSADSADVAIRILEARHDIRLVFTDIDMPGSMDGLKLAAFVRGRWPPINIVVASGRHRPDPDDLPLNAVFIPKPYMTGDVIAVFNRFG